MKLIIKISIVFITMLTSIVYAQQNVVYNGQTFKLAEVIEAQIGNSGETLSFTMSEIDMSPNGDWAKKVRELERQGKNYNPEDAPKPLSLLLSVDFKKKFKFPITEEDSVYINFSYTKEGIQEGKFNKEQANKMNSSMSKTDVKSLKEDKIAVEEQAQKISKQLQEGKISPQEAMKKIEALTKPMMDQLDNSAIINQETTEFKQNRATYSILFGDSPQNEDATPYEGTLHIVEFNSERLIAYFKGMHYVECTDVARANDKSKPCEVVETGLYPEHKVLKIEPVNAEINVTFKSFIDNR